MQRLTTRPRLVSLKVKPNWFASKWLAGICIAWFLLVSGAAAQTTEEPSPEPQVAVTQAADAQTLSQSQSASDIQNLRERLQRQEDVVWEMQYKNIDFWFTALTVMIGVLGIFGAFLPYLIGRNTIKEQSLLIKTDREAAGKELDETRQFAQNKLKEAQDLVDSIKSHEKQAAHDCKEIRCFRNGVKQSTSNKAGLLDEAKRVQENPYSSESDKLRASAVLASQEDNPSVEQAQQAYDLWQALTILQPQDALAQFNAGYWAQKLFAQKAVPGSAYWLQKLKQHYGLALEIKPDFHEALYNWGSALDDEAQALAGQDLSAACRLWQEARGKYSEAFKIKPDKHKVLYNWGIALAAEAKALAGQDLLAACRLWQEAGSKYSEALKIKPDKHEALNNWGSALAAEAKALAGQDFIEARRLWQEARGKYSDALEIKPNYHVGLKNWGVAFLDEILALKIHQPENKTEIKGLLDQAQKVLEKPELSGDTQGQVKCAYVLASIYAMQGKATECVEQLKIAQKAKILPSKADLEKDRDLDDVRGSGVFQKWWSSF